MNSSVVPTEFAAEPTPQRQIRNLNSLPSTKKTTEFSFELFLSINRPVTRLKYLAGRANWPSQSPTPPPPPPDKIQMLKIGRKAYKNSCQIDTNTVHSATVCVNFVKKDTFMVTSFLENLPKSCFLFAFSATKFLATSTRFIASVSKKYP